MSEAKYCKDCANYDASTPDGCNQTSNVIVDLVSGQPERLKTPRQMRAVDGPCGPDATLFEAQPST